MSCWWVCVFEWVLGVLIVGVCDWFFFGAEYKDLEDRVDALRASHLGMLKCVQNNQILQVSHI